MGRRQKDAAPEGGNNDALNRMMTVSLFIILLAFFIVLNSIAVIDERRKREAIGSLLGSFGILPGGFSAMKGSGRDFSAPLHPIIPSERASPPEFVGLSAEKSGMVDIRETPRGAVVSIQDQLLFVEGSDTIAPSSQAFLRELCRIINQDGYPVEISGHTDNMPAEEKGVSSNWELSARRAMAVHRFFIEQGQVTPRRLTVFGCGPYRPAVSNETRETRAKNRRVEVLVDRRAEKRLRQLYRSRPSGLYVFRRFVFKLFE